MTAFNQFDHCWSEMLYNVFGIDNALLTFVLCVYIQSASLCICDFLLAGFNSSTVEHTNSQVERCLMSQL